MIRHLAFILLAVTALAAPAHAQYAYSNNGLTFRAWNQPNNLAQGEVYFSSIPTSDQLSVAFPGYAAAIEAMADAESAQATYDAAVKTGLIIACAPSPSVCSSAMTGQWALDGTTLDQIGSVARDFGSNLGLPGGLSTFTYPDFTGTPRTMSGAQVQSLYKAERDYMLGLQTALSTVQAGGEGQWPTATATIP